MQLCPKTVFFKTAYQHKKYYFCASGCLQKFKKNPQKYDYSKRKNPHKF
ncbi:YHS domain-containing protein [Patescibacteria group bacterium]|nr:YHS domain-containing protein [Patescibacteria group bacterium]